MKTIKDIQDYIASWSMEEVLKHRQTSSLDVTRQAIDGTALLSIEQLDYLRAFHPGSNTLWFSGYPISDAKTQFSKTIFLLEEHKKRNS